MSATKIGRYEVHPAAAILPMLDEQELRELASDIGAHGQHHPIILHEGKILDGRNRMAACLMVQATPSTENWMPNGSPTAYVLSANLKRRHLTPGQKAAVATDSLALFEEEARERQSKLNGKSQLPVIVPGAEKGDARDKAAAAVGVSPRYVSDAKTIKDQSPETFDRVKAGEISIPQAKRELKTLEEAAETPKWKEAVAQFNTQTPGDSSTVTHSTPRLAEKERVSPKCVRASFRKLRRGEQVRLIVDNRKDLLGLLLGRRLEALAELWEAASYQQRQTLLKKHAHDAACHLSCVRSGLINKEALGAIEHKKEAAQ